MNKNTDVMKQEMLEGTAVSSAVRLRGLLDKLHNLSKDDFHESKVTNAKTKIVDALHAEQSYCGMCTSDIHRCWKF